MKFSTIALATATAVSAQVVYENGEFKCLGDAAGKNFCAGDSLSTNIIIRCTGEQGQPGNCNNNLAGVPPVGVKFAQCYQSSNTTGDAACSYNGVVYPDSGEPFPIPGYQSGSTSTSIAAPTSYEPAPSSYEPAPSSYEPAPSSYEPAPSQNSTTVTETQYPTVPSTTVYVPPSTLHTVTGTVTVTSCDTTSKTYVPTDSPSSYPPANHTTYTTSLPIPTQIPSGAGTILAKDGIVLGALALVGFFLL